MPAHFGAASAERLLAQSFIFNDDELPKTRSVTPAIHSLVVLPLLVLALVWLIVTKHGKKQGRKAEYSLAMADSLLSPSYSSSGYTSLESYDTRQHDSYPCSQIPDTVIV